MNVQNSDHRREMTREHRQEIERLLVNIGKGIRFVRIASGIRQGAMAKRLNISQNYLSLLENNKAEPSVALLKKISETFGVPASFLFWEDVMPLEGETAEVTEKYRRIRSLVHELQELRISRQFREATE